MNRALSLGLPALLLSMAVGESTTAEAATGANVPVCADCNVLWLVIDTTRADYVGFLGNKDGNTPHIDRLAGRGIVFEQGWTQGAETMISVSSYATGRYNRNTDMNFTIFNRDAVYHPMSPELTTVAEVLSSKGYKTAGMTANMVIAKGVKFDLELHHGFQEWAKGTDAEVADYGIKQLDALKGEKFFLYLHMMGPHHPNAELPGFKERRGAFPAGMPEAENNIYREVNNGKRTLSDEEARYMRALYADALWEADGQMGRVLDHLAKLGLDRKTLVIFTSDHGESLGELHNGKPVWGHGHALTDPLLHVPLVMAGPGLSPGVREKSQMAELVDLAPTIVSYLGISEEPAWGWDGDPLVGKGLAVGNTSISDRGIPGHSNAAIRSLTHGVMWWETANKWFYTNLKAAGDAEYAYVGADAEHKRLQALLQSYMDSAHPPKAGTGAAAPEGDTLEQLKELGYVE